VPVSVQALRAHGATMFRSIKTLAGKKIVVSVIQLVLVVLSYLAFFSLTPWLGCQPIAELNSTGYFGVQPPQSTVCFTSNHGQIAFYQHGLISLEPGRFILHLIAFCFPVLTIAILTFLSQKKTTTTTSTRSLLIKSK
jgi:hypothetical protein